MYNSNHGLCRNCFSGNMWKYVKIFDCTDGQVKVIITCDCMMCEHSWIEYEGSLHCLIYHTMESKCD